MFQCIVACGLPSTPAEEQTDHDVPTRRNARRAPGRTTDL
jgi:hypothetical protein